jgi:hypothetical protein
MIKITIEETEQNTSVVGQFSFVEETDGSAYDYVRRSADLVARQFFLAPVPGRLVLAVDKGNIEIVPVVVPD